MSSFIKCLQNIFKILGFTCLVIPIIITGCDKSNEQISDLPTQLSIKASIENIKKSTSRYAEGNINKTDFNTNDSIGLFINKGAVTKWVYNKNWIPQTKVLWPEQNDEHEFCAFYPYSKNSSYEKVILPLLSNQEGTVESLEKYDFIVASKMQSKKLSSVVEFVGEDNNFKHKLCLLSLNLYAVYDLNGAIVKRIKIISPNIACRMEYSFEDNDISVDTNTSGDTICVLNQEIDMKGSNKIVYCMVPPFSDESVISLVVEYRLNGEECTAVSSDFADNNFKAGTLQSYNVYVENNNISILSTTVAPWDVDEIKDLKINKN